MPKRSVRWKETEREVAALFGGRRVPLSGRSSGHKTSADVMEDEESELPYPKFLYCEVKRSRIYNQFFSLCNNFLRRGGEYIVVENGIQYRFFELKSFLKKAISKRVLLEKGPYKPLLNLHKDSAKKAKEENKTATLVVCKIHGKRGFFAVADIGSYNEIEKWRKENASLLKTT